MFNPLTPNDPYMGRTAPSELLDLKILHVHIYIYV